MVNKGKIPTKTEINILKKNEAKQKLESLNLDSNGSRPELHERLMIYYHGIDSVKKEKKVKVREFTRYEKLYNSGKFTSKSLARFHRPKIVKGTSF